jgi:hypothetical protein
MAQQKRTTMDDITTLAPVMVHARSLAELPPHEHTIKPLSLLEEPKVRTRLSVYVVLVALYVNYPIVALHEHQLPKNISLARRLPSSARSNYHRNIHPHNFRLSALSFRLHLDRRCLLTSQCRIRSNLGQMQRYLGSQACSLRSSCSVCCR